jgi:hypothetical protein
MIVRQTKFRSCISELALYNSLFVGNREVPQAHVQPVIAIRVELAAEVLLFGSIY